VCCVARVGGRAAVLIRPMATLLQRLGFLLHPMEGGIWAQKKTLGPRAPEGLCGGCYRSSDPRAATTFFASACAFSASPGNAAHAATIAA